MKTITGFFNPFSVAVDSTGKIYVTEPLTHTIKLIQADGSIQIYAGISGISGNFEGQGAAARFSNPQGIAVDRAGNVYVADTGNHVIKKINQTGYVFKIAGSGLAGNADGNVTAASFNFPHGIAVNSVGNIFIADTLSNSIRLITTDGIVSTLAGGLSIGSANGVGANARFNGPRGISVDSLGNVYVADTFNNRIRMINITGFVSTLAGFMNGYQNGAGSVAAFRSPIGVVATSNNSIYVADTNNNAIRLIDSSSTVSTFAGNLPSTEQINGTTSTFILSNPSGVAIDDIGNVYVADRVNNVVRVFYRPPEITTISYASNPPDSKFYVTIKNLQKGALQVTFASSLTPSLSTTCNRTDAISLPCDLPSISYGTTYDITVTIFSTLFGPMTSVAYSFMFLPPICEITSVAPQIINTTGGTEIRISGLYFFQTTDLDVTIGDKPCITPPVLIANQIFCNAPAGIGINQSIKVIFQGVEANSNNITVSYSPPVILEITPSSTYSSSELQIGGSDFGLDFSEVYVYLKVNFTMETISCENPIWKSDKTISCKIPIDFPIGGYSVAVSVGNQSSTFSSSISNLPPPEVISVFPSTGPAVGETLINVEVQNFNDITNFAVQFVGGAFTIPASNCIKTASNLINCTTPAVPITGAYDVKLVVGDLSNTLLTGYTYDPAIITDIYPNTGPGIGGYEISIIGKNFGTGCCANALVFFGNTACSNSQRFNDSIITCTAPPGSGSLVPTIQLNDRDLTNTFRFNYNPPVVTTINPTSGYGSFQLIISGSEFGRESDALAINLISNDLSVPCNIPIWQSSIRLQCTTPASLFGNYTIQVSVNQQVSSQLVQLAVVAAPPPVASDVSVVGIQAAVPIPILVNLNARTSLTSPLSYLILNTPRNGSLFQYLTGSAAIGPEIQGTKQSLFASRLYYVPDIGFSGTDQFTYFANDGSDSNFANVVISIDFRNQPPFFTSSSYTLSLSGNTANYEIDFDSLINDIDEYSNFTMQFLSFPERGKWKFNGEEAFKTNSTILQKSQRNILQLELDGGVGVNPYFKFSSVVYDSYGMMSTNELEVTGVINCAPPNVVHTWGMGEICVPCPPGAICSAAGDEPITNDFGYYALETELNNQTTLIFIRCVPPDACPAGLYKNSIQSCSVGYSGSRCGVCAENYYSYGSVCNKCPDLNLSPVLLGVIAFFALIIVLYLAYKMSKMDVGFIGVVYTYFQVSPECFRATSPGQSFQFKYFVTLAIPVCIVFTGTFLYICYYLYTKVLNLFRRRRAAEQQEKRSPTVISQLLSSTLLAMKFLFLTLATTILSIFNCNYDSASGTYYFEPAPSRFCYIQSWWWDLLPYTVFTLLIYVCGTILISTLVETKAGVVRKRVKYLNALGTKSTHNLTKREYLLLDMTQTDFPVYRQEFLYWDAIIMVRKLLLSIVLNFMTHTPQTQCILLIIIFLISLVIQNQHKPFYKENINTLEETTLISSSMVLLVGLIASTKETTDPVFVFFLGILLVTFICGSGLLMFWKILRHWYIAGKEAKEMMKNKLKKSFGSLNSIERKARVL